MKFPEAIGTREILIGAGILVVLLVATIPLVGYVRDKSKRSELPLLVESIRAAEMAQGTSFQLEGYISAEWSPRAPTSLNSTAVEWTGNEGFQRLGWSPEKEGYSWVRGTYRVAATRKGFTVTGKCDLDDDGVPAWYEATADKAATSRSDAGAYGAGAGFSDGSVADDVCGTAAACDLPFFGERPGGDLSAHAAPPHDRSHRNVDGRGARLWHRRARPHPRLRTRRSPTHHYSARSLVHTRTHRRRPHAQGGGAIGPTCLCRARSGSATRPSLETLGDAVKIAVGFGSSLGQRQSLIRDALRRLDRSPGLRLLRSSSLYRTPPMRGGQATGWFLNAVATYECTLTPHEVLAVCQAVERAAGRRRARHWGDRTLDLDLLLVQGVHLRTPDLVIPHAGIASRPFVLDPLIEIWPDAIDPRTGHAYRDARPAPGPRAVRVGVLARPPRLVTPSATPTNEGPP